MLLEALEGPVRVDRAYRRDPVKEVDKMFQGGRLVANQENSGPAAGSAGAVNAGSAGSAGRAGSAGSAGSAGRAVSAVRAVNAGSAVNADRTAIIAA